MSLVGEEVVLPAVKDLHLLRVRRRIVEPLGRLNREDRVGGAVDEDFGYALQARQGPRGASLLRREGDHALQVGAAGAAEVLGLHSRQDLPEHGRNPQGHRAAEGVPDDADVEAGVGSSLVRHLLQGVVHGEHGPLHGLLQRRVHRLPADAAGKDPLVGELARQRREEAVGVEVGAWGAARPDAAVGARAEDHEAEHRRLRGPGEVYVHLALVEAEGVVGLEGVAGRPLARRPQAVHVRVARRGVGGVSLDHLELLGPELEGLRRPSVAELDHHGAPTADAEAQHGADAAGGQVLVGAPPPDLVAHVDSLPRLPVEQLAGRHAVQGAPAAAYDDAGAVAVDKRRDLEGDAPGDFLVGEPPGH
mmetsp:Transcript_15322/g.33504  ORF Transcript_15322/g.33504 Transcript_15322/m.33504 type:complete len:362 (+) Transcript_15322:289-1374(+)